SRPVLGGRLSVAATAGTRDEGQERGTGYDGRRGQDVRGSVYALFGDGVRKGALDEQGEWTAPPWHGQGLVVD
ncbi:hypothetical protein L210DRAFT_3762774, partial [Boletus edulis BED1]